MLPAIPRQALVTVASIDAASVGPTECMIEKIKDSASTRRGLGGGDKDEGRLDTTCAAGFDEKWRSKANISLVLSFKPRIISRPWYRVLSLIPTTLDPTCWTADLDVGPCCSPTEVKNLGVVFVAVDMCKSALMLFVNQDVLTLCLL
jgi:hypothetical protein